MLLIEILYRMTTLSCLLVYLFTKNFGIAGYALKARGIFAGKNAKCIYRGNRLPGALPRAVGNIWAYSPPQSFDMSPRF